MVRKIIYLLLVSVMLITFSGCNRWAEGSYYSVEKIQDVYDSPQPDLLVANSYTQLQNILVDMVEKAVQKGTITTTNISQTDLKDYMQDVVSYITTKVAIGAFAVEEITYEVGTNNGKTAVAVDIAYNRAKAEILQISVAEDMEEASQFIYKALDSCEQEVAFVVHNFESVDIPQIVTDYANAMPDSVMETPQVAVAVYPDVGSERIVELIFTYQTSREELRLMQDQVQPVFTAAQLYVSGSNNALEKIQQLYSFLMERYDYKIETSITPSYSLLCHGVGDSRAFANAFAAMCRYAQLDCEVITGTKDGAPWCWNILDINGKYYYIDLISCSRSGGFTLKIDSDLVGYVWDYSRIRRQMS